MSLPRTKYITLFFREFPITPYHSGVTLNKIDIWYEKPLKSVSTKSDAIPELLV